MIMVPFSDEGVMGEIVGGNDGGDGGNGGGFVYFVAEILAVFAVALHQRRRIRATRSG